MSQRYGILLALVALVFAACDQVDPFGPEDTVTENVTLQFGTATPTTTSASLAPTSLGTRSVMADDTLVVAGTNGTLIITDIRLIAEEFELKAVDGTCGTASDTTSTDGGDEGDDDEEEDDQECPDFEAPPAFVDLPLAGGAVAVASDEVPVGTYDELKFKVEDIDLTEEEDEDERAEIQALADSVFAAYPDWPEDASMVAVGTFVTDTDTTAFTVYFEAEIEVEIEMEANPIEITETGASESLTIQLAPENWFLDNGAVLNLAEFDYETTGTIVEFELEFEKGIGGVEKDDDDEDEDEDEGDDD